MVRLCWFEWWPQAEKHIILALQMLRVLGPPMVPNVFGPGHVSTVLAQDELLVAGRDATRRVGLSLAWETFSHYWIL